MLNEAQKKIENLTNNLQQNNELLDAKNRFIQIQSQIVNKNKKEF